MDPDPHQFVSEGSEVRSPDPLFDHRFSVGSGTWDLWKMGYHDGFRPRCQTHLDQCPVAV